MKRPATLLVIMLVFGIALAIGVTALASPRNAMELGTASIETPASTSTPTLSAAPAIEETPTRATTQPTREPSMPTAPTTSTQPAPDTPDLSTTPTPTPSLTPTDEIANSEMVDKPVRIIIPAIGLDTSVEWVGLDTQGNMAVPSAYDTTAWFEHGARPGMPGNAVIAGHLDSRSGPAIFFALDQLVQGDEIQVESQDGSVLRFKVERLQAYDPDEAPRYEIFGPSSEQRLNLITCEGDFNAAAGAYDQRLVVFTVLVKD